MGDIIQTGGAAGAGGIIGAVSAFFGIKAQISGLAKRVDRMEDGVVYDDTLAEVVKRLDERNAVLHDELRYQRNKLDAIHRDMPKRHGGGGGE